MAGILLATGFVLAAAGPLLLRLGWNGPRSFVALGWMALLLAAVIVTTSEGAWGLAVGTALASTLALGLLALAAARTPAPASLRPERATAIRPALPFSLPDTARRIGVFVIVALLDLVAALALGWSCERFAYLAGMADADSLVLGAFAVPLAWTVLASWQLTCTRPTTMFLAALAVALPGGLAWLTL